MPGKLSKPRVAQRTLGTRRTRLPTATRLHITAQGRAAHPGYATRPVTNRNAVAHHSPGSRSAPWVRDAPGYQPQRGCTSKPRVAQRTLGITYRIPTTTYPNGVQQSGVEHRVGVLVDHICRVPSGGAMPVPRVRCATLGFEIERRWRSCRLVLQQRADALKKKMVRTPQWDPDHVVVKRTKSRPLGDCGCLGQPAGCL